MSMNASSFAGLSLLPPPPPLSCFPNSSLHPPLTFMRSRNCQILFYTFFIINLLDLLLPFVLLLLLRCRQRRTQRRVSAADRDVDVVSHSMVMQLQQLSGITLYFFAGYVRNEHLVWAGINILCVGSHGQVLLHLLTCVERYMAVVHPVFFMGLRKTGVVKLRNACLCLVWLLCSVWTVVLQFNVSLDLMVFYLSFTIFLLAVISLCTIEVLRVLRRPCPGEVGGRTRRVDPSKQRAFRTMLTILTALSFRLFGNVSCAVLVSNTGQNILSCVWVMLTAGFEIPSNSVLPALYLHRVRKQLLKK